MNILNRIIQVTGIDRNLVAEHFAVSVNQVAHWEVDGSTVPVGRLASLVEDFDEATTALDERGLTWDNALAFRYAARLRGVTPYTLSIMLARRDIEPMDFGCLGLWITAEEYQACR